MVIRLSIIFWCAAAAIDFLHVYDCGLQALELELRAAVDKLGQNIRGEGAMIDAYVTKAEIASQHALASQSQSSKASLDNRDKASLEPDTELDQDVPDEFCETGGSMYRQWVKNTQTIDKLTLSGHSSGVRSDVQTGHVESSMKYDEM